MAYSPMIYATNPYYPQGNMMDQYRMPQSQQYQAPTVQNSGTDERIWVQSEQAAEAYLVAPNSFVRLWDSQKPVFYEKRADATGKPLPIDVYEYTKKDVNITNSALLTERCTIDYAEEIDALNERITALESILKKGVKKDAKQSNADDSTVQSV